MPGFYYAKMSGSGRQNGMKKLSAASLKQLLFVLVVLYWFSLYVHVPVQTPYLHSLGCSGLVTGCIIGSYGVAQMLLRIPLGVRCDKSGNLFPFLLVGAGVIPVQAVIRCFFVHDPWALLLANTLGGLAAAMWISIIALFGVLFAPEELHQALAYATTGNSVGMLTATLACAVLSVSLDMAGLSAVEIVGGVIVLLLSVWVYLGAEQKDVELICPSREAVRKTLKNKRLWRFGMLTFVHQGLILSTILSFATRRAEQLGATKVQVGLAVFLYWIVTVVINHYAGKPLFMRWGAKFWLPFGLSVAALYCFLMGSITELWMLFALQMAGGLFGGTTIPFAMSQAMQEIPLETRTTGIGVFQAVLAAGMVILPPVAGASIEALGNVWGFAVLGCIALCAAAYSAWLTHRRYHARQTTL